MRTTHNGATVGVKASASTRPATTPTVQRAWWKEASVYQVYPSSFKDSNGDGIGDIAGIVEKLDYIKAFGVDLVWICPVYSSPQVDMGYDIADYRAVDPRYGTMEDIEQLIQELHRRGLRLVQDLVVNHTSDQHEWFRQSRSSKTNAFREWYIWRKPHYGSRGERQPPNNWSSYFGGSAWEYDEASDEYYLHLFAKEQPDLNWECDAMRNEVYDTMRFWLDKGVDGFRLDVINLISKVPSFPDAEVVRPEHTYQHGSKYYANGPRIHEYLRVIGGILAEYDAFSVGEMPWISDSAEILDCVGSDRHELNMIFNFDIVEGIDHGSGGKFSPKQWQMSELKTIVNKWQHVMHDHGGWNALFLENHDQARTVSRWGSDKSELRAIVAKMFATFLGFQSGTLFLYQGQELGMTNIPNDWDMDEFHDIETLNHWEALCSTTNGDPKQQALTKAQYHLKSRDNARTPMQWNGGLNAGFTDGEPWFRVNDSYLDCNAESQVGVPGTPFEHWAAILRLRKQDPELFIYGRFEMVDPNHEDVFAYTRSCSNRVALVVCNFREWNVDWTIPSNVAVVKETETLIASCGRPILQGSTFALRPFEAFVCSLGRVSSHL
ncbi:hypothetical protein LTR15_003458 [Elasticomyces elasticus]|nr:hypothetical protein LTR15_003458 [Elasticomyces elasticus]